MHPVILDILFVVCMLLGGGYMLCTALMGGLSHAAGHIGHVGDSLHVPHLSDLAEMGGHHGAAGAGHGDAGGHGHVGGHGHADVHHADSQQGDADESQARGSLLSAMNPMVASAFLFGFGGTGFVSRLFGLGTWPSVGLGAGGGLAIWWAVAFIIVKVFGMSQGTSHNRREQLIGTRAQVTVPIDGARPGMVCYTVLGSRQSMRAITEDGDTLPTGALVRIRRVEQNTLYVSRLD